MAYARGSLPGMREYIMGGARRMFLEKMYEMQKELDARIIKDKELQGVDLIPNTVLALQVEIGELANEWRGFKHWSNDQKSRPKMLEEYVDCVHFFLSIARQLNLPPDDLYAPITDMELKESTVKVFIEVIHHVGGVMLNHSPAARRQMLRLGFFVFLALGEQRLGFTFEQIAAAYVEKNQVNHDRQATGY